VGQQDNSLAEQNDDEESEEVSDGDVGGYALFDPDDTETYMTAGLILLRTLPTLILGTDITEDERKVIYDRWTHYPHRPEPLTGFGFSDPTSRWRRRTKSSSCMVSRMILRAKREMKLRMRIEKKAAKCLRPENGVSTCPSWTLDSSHVCVAGRGQHVQRHRCVVTFLRQ
jgi:hypothetical protein